MLKIISRAISVLLTNERSQLFRIILLNTINSILDIAALALLLVLIQFYTRTAIGSASRFGGIISQLEGIHFLLPLALILLLFLFKNACAFLLVKYQYRYIYSVANRLSNQNMYRYLNSDYYEYSRINPSVHISRISYQPTEYATFVLSGIQQLSTEAILTTLTIIAILLFKAKLFLLLLLIILPPVAISAYFSRKKLNAARGNVKPSAEKTTQYLNEALAAYVEGNIYNRKRFFADRYSGSHKDLLKRLSILQTVQAIPPRLMELFAVLGLLTLIILNRYSGNTGVELVDIGAFMAAAYKIIPGIARMANVSGQMRMYSHTIDDLQPDPRSRHTETEPAAPISRITFNHVSVGHDAHFMLRDLSLELVSGDFLGISADSGKGKTTMINLLLGFLEERSGVIAFNGKTVTATERKSFWPSISLVKQQPFIIDDTIAGNISLSEQSDDQRLQHAIGFAGLNDFIQSMPEGIHQRLSDSGKNISGGQRQRIALARAVYKEADLIILDEPFSELDTSSEQEILLQLKELSRQGKMIILITHNKQSLSFCSKTISIDA